MLKISNWRADGGDACWHRAAKSSSREKAPGFGSGRALVDTCTQRGRLPISAHTALECVEIGNGNECDTSPLNPRMFVW